MRRGPLNLTPHPEGKNEMMAESSGDESPGRDYEDQFTKLLTERIIEALKVNYSDRPNMKNLLRSVIEDDLRKLLQQYLHCQLNIISSTLNNEFIIEESVCYTHATHAKFSNHIKAIKQMCQMEAGVNFTERRKAANSDKLRCDCGNENFVIVLEGLKCSACPLKYKYKQGVLERIDDNSETDQR